MSRALAVALAGLLTAWTGAARAETRRVAIVVGNNAGSGDQPPLHYAEDDAGKVARTFSEVGDVGRDDLELLQGRSLAELDAAFTRAQTRTAAYHAQGDARVLLVFYFSGHSDGEALELGKDWLPFTELRRRLQATGAEVRLAIVDSCRSGGLLTLKGGTRGNGFQIRLTDELATSGQVLLTSSAADEVALESKELRGSYFTESFLSGLRGAADSSGDGRVTLSEAYQYAYVHTVSATAATEIGPQHPEFDVQLSGEGELVLAELGHPAAALALPEGFERALVTDLVRDQVIAELVPGAARQLAVVPGPYGVKMWRDGRAFTGRVQIAAGEVHPVAWTDVKQGTEIAAATKGDAPMSVAATPSATPNGLELGVGLGVGYGVTNVGLALADVTLRGATAQGSAVTIAVGTGRAADYRETTALALVGYRLGTDLGPVRAWIAGEAGAGVAVQGWDTGEVDASPIGAAAASLGAAVHITGPLALTAEAQLPVALTERDGKAAWVILPFGWLGLAVGI